MEVEKQEVNGVSEAEEVKMPTEKEKKLAIEKFQIEQRNKEAEEKSRTDGFIVELRPLCEKWNVELIADVRFFGVGNNVQTALNVGARALPKKEVLEINTQETDEQE